MAKAKAELVDRSRSQVVAGAESSRPPGSRPRSSRGARRSPLRAPAPRGSGRGCGRRSRGPASLRAVWMRLTTSRARPSATSSGVSCGVEGDQQLAVARGRHALALDQPDLELVGRELDRLAVELEARSGPSRSSSLGQRVAVGRGERRLDRRHPLAEALAEDSGRSACTSWCTKSARRSAQRISLTLSSSSSRSRVAVDLAASAARRRGATSVAAASGWRVLRSCVLRAARPSATIRCASGHRARPDARSRRDAGAAPASAPGGRSPARCRIEAAHQVLVQRLGDERRERRDQARERGQHLVERLVGALLVRAVLRRRRPEAIAAAADVPVGEVVDERLERAAPASAMR